MASFGGGFGGFGSNNNNQQQSTGFGGFGSNNTSGFGNTQNTGFGASTNNNAGGSIFGTGGTTFGASTSTPFGSTAKPAFGGASGGGLFGSSTPAASTSSGFGSGFGTHTNSTTPAFGSGNASGGLFSKPAFGATNTNSGGLFGNTGSTFNTGQTTNTSAFGAPQATALGGPVGEASGTAITPFQAFNEKEPNSNITNHYQAISFMQPYQKYSFEELRQADYNQGRRYGNSNGQAGAFGATTSFGAFGTGQPQATGFGGTGTTGGGLFGSQPASSSTPFGNATQTTGGFGSSAGGGLFGQKPATSLFGTPAATTTQTSGGLFGTAGQTGFGSQQSTVFGSAGTGGLFGNTQPQQEKPGFSFGGAPPTANTGFGQSTGFGGGASTGGGLFGGGGTTQTPSLFGNTQQQQQPSTNPFGQQPAQAQSAFGGFGNQQKPGGLFGNATSATPQTGTGLFGNTQQQTATTGFGAPAANSLFGPKPAAASGSSLFGNTASSSTGGGGLFGNNAFGGNTAQNQQPQGSSLFGNNNQQQQQKPGGLFGTAPGGSLFGNNQASNAGGLFGAPPNNQNQPSGSIFGNNNNNNPGPFGNSQQNPLQPPQGLTASMFNQSPYGSQSIFSGLPPPPATSAGPIATPISTGNKTKKLAALPQYKINPIMAARLVTPQKRGYGFSYSNYGTPSSVSSISSTPGGFGSSLLGSSIGRSFGKSLSTSNLRRTFDNDADSVLSPGAFSAGSARYGGGGSMKKLTIDRSLRTDLFGSQALAALPSPERSDTSRQSSILKKKVSFDSNAVGGNGASVETNGSGNHYPDEENSATPSAQEQGYLRSSSRANGRSASKANSTPAQPEMEQVKGNELAIVHEDGSPENTSLTVHQGRSDDQFDPEPGQYYIRPSREELKKLPKDQLKKVSGFCIGREDCGHVVFDQPVDLTTVDLDNVFDNICVITLRSLTVYPDQTKKPLLGKGLNVPSTITLRNSWPRQRDRKTPSYEKSGIKFNKHVDRLRKVTGTEFVNYNKDTGEWIFRVPHFTTYGFDYEDEGDTLQSSMLSELPDTPTPKSRTPKANPTPMSYVSEVEGSSVTESSQFSSGPDDTFEFKKKKLFPGAFDDVPAFDDTEMEEIEQDRQSFLDERSALSASDNGDDEPSDVMEDSEMQNDSLVIHDDERMVIGSFPQQDVDDEPFQVAFQASHFGIRTPGKSVKDMGSDWMQQLQRTISPRKQDRQALKESQALLFKEHDMDLVEMPKSIAPVRDGSEIVTSIDLMNSLFGQEQLRKSGRAVKKGGKAKGFEWPYSKRTDDQPEMTEDDRLFHQSFKPSWGPGEKILHPSAKRAMGEGPAPSNASLMVEAPEPIVSEGRDITVSEFVIFRDIVAGHFEQQRAHTRITLDHGVPLAVPQPYQFESYLSDVSGTHGREQNLFDLAGILFDDYDDDIPDSIPEDQRQRLDSRIRKDRLSRFWATLCQPSANLALDSNRADAEERAIIHLSMHNVSEACNVLAERKDFRLATLVAQIGGDRTTHEVMATQIEAWRNLNVLSEMTDSIRTLYGLLAGNTCVCEGKKGQLEDRARTFVISERWHLGWKNVFGLKLWYGTLTEEPLQVTVRKFAADLEEKEVTKPLPWFIESAADTMWKDNSPEQRIDPLWGILKLFTDAVDNTQTIRLSDMVMPQNTVGNPIHTRLSFDLYHGLQTRLPLQADPSAADQLAWNFAAELESAGSWTWAVFAVMHLSKPDHRQLAIQELLARNASRVDEHDSETLQLLFDEFKIPEGWLWQAKALFARSVLQNHVKELEYLLRAKHWQEAHKTLCEVVAPQAIVEQNYTTLQQLLNNFTGKDQVHGWDLGGQIYEDYVGLAMGLPGTGRSTVVRRLLRTLPAMVHERPGKLGFVQRVAVEEMSSMVGKAVLGDEENSSDRWRVLRLPLAENKHLKHTVDLSLQYYKTLMGAGK